MDPPKNILYDNYLADMSVGIIYVLSTMSLIIPYMSRVAPSTIPLPVNGKIKQISGKGKPNTAPLKFSPNITNNFWNPLLCFLSISIVFYSIGIMRKLKK